MAKSIVSSRFSGGVRSPQRTRELDAGWMVITNATFIANVIELIDQADVSPELLNVLYLLLHFNVVC